MVPKRVVMDEATQWNWRGIDVAGDAATAAGGATSAALPVLLHAVCGPGLLPTQSFRIDAVHLLPRPGQWTGDLKMLESAQVQRFSSNCFRISNAFPREMGFFNLASQWPLRLLNF